MFLPYKFTMEFLKQLYKSFLFFFNLFTHLHNKLTLPGLFILHSRKCQIFRGRIILFRAYKLHSNLLFLIEVQSTSDYLELLLVNAFDVLEQLPDLIPPEHIRHLPAEYEVQELADRKGQGTGQAHEQVHDVTCARAHRQAMLGAHGLRHDLAEHDNQKGGSDRGINTCHIIALIVII